MDRMETYSRRNFLAVAGAAACSAKSYAQIIGANERLRIGVIGCGGMATHHMKSLMKVKEKDNIEILAVCDVWQKRLEDAAALTGGKKVPDYRSLLADKDIDYVLIATPEHWHAQMALDAISAGKNIYLEKPMAHTIDEAKKVVGALKQHPTLKFQVGVQGMSDNSYEVANEYVKRGTLGKVVLAQIDYSRNHVEEFWQNRVEPDARPGENLDWKAWLGPAPKRPWDPDRYFSWRRYWDYSGGIATDLFVHRAARIVKSLGLKFPSKVIATGGKFYWEASAAEIPDTFNVLADYPEGLTVQLISTMANDTAVQHMLRGHKATLTFTKTGFTITPQKDFAKEVEPVTFTKTGAEEVVLHHRNLQNAIRKNEALKCDVTLGYHSLIVCLMSVQSFRKKQYLAWDAGSERTRKA